MKVRPTNPEPITIGQRIRRERKAQDMTRPELAKRANMPYSTLAEIENDRQKSSTRLHDICAAFNRPVRVEYIADNELPKYVDADKGPGLIVPPSGAWPFPNVTPEQWFAIEDTLREYIMSSVETAAHKAKESAPRGRRHRRTKS